MSTGLPTLAAAGRKDAQLRGGSATESAGTSRPPRGAGVRGQDPGTAGVGQDADAPPCRDRLVREEHRHVEQLLERRRPDDACLAKEGVHDLVALASAAVWEDAARAARARTART